MASESERSLTNLRQPDPRRLQAQGSGGPANLADILERVLDKGIVIAGDIQVNLLDIELLTIKIRLLVASVERAQEMGINWWESDPTLTRGSGSTGSAKAQETLEQENLELRARLDRLERAVAGALPPEQDDLVRKVERSGEPEES